MWSDNCDVFCSLRGRRLEVVGTWKTGAREGDTRGERELPHLSRVLVLSFAHFFQASATQATYFALTQSVLYVLQPMFAPPPTPPKNIANHGELKESHFEMSHSISLANNQGPPTTVSSLINFIQIHSCMSVCFPCWRRCLRCAKRCSLFRGCLLRSAHRWILIGVLQRSFNGKSFSARICRHLLCLQFCVISMGNCSWFADGKHCLTDGQVYVVWKHTCSLTSLADTKGIFMKR